ncbi:MAG TPA: hypothetical protein VM733_14150 [Thermoanaerobaculia bacterium]|nr:hypothetical protein [Thermoanaerobaculia bacterium]
MSDPASVVSVFSRHLATYIGQHTAPMAIKTFAKQALGMTPEQLKTPDTTKLLDAMRPMLSTLLGKQQADEVATLIRRDLGV